MTVNVPSLPFRITGVFSSRASIDSSTPTMAGSPSARARMAMCEVGPPSTMPNPSTRSGSKEAVSEGDNSRATITTGVVGMAVLFSLTPSISRRTRLPTSRRSSARAASSGSLSAAIAAARSSMVAFQALRVSAPCSHAPEPTPINSGSSSSSLCASKIAASVPSFLSVIC